MFVWIHGGSNQAGMGAMLAGDLLAARTKIIVINLNYRLDALGKNNFNILNFKSNLKHFLIERCTDLFPILLVGWGLRSST